MRYFLVTSYAMYVQWIWEGFCLPCSMHFWMSTFQAVSKSRVKIQSKLFLLFGSVECRVWFLFAQYMDETGYFFVSKIGENPLDFVKLNLWKRKLCECKFPNISMQCDHVHALMQYGTQRTVDRKLKNDWRSLLHSSFSSYKLTNFPGTTLFYDITLPLFSSI